MYIKLVLSAPIMRYTECCTERWSHCSCVKKMYRSEKKKKRKLRCLLSPCLGRKMRSRQRAAALALPRATWPRFGASRIRNPRDPVMLRTSRRFPELRASLRHICSMARRRRPDIPFFFRRARVQRAKLTCAATDSWHDGGEPKYRSLLLHHHMNSKCFHFAGSHQPSFSATTGEGGA